MSQPSRRNSLRYPGFDYSQPAGVFVTIATHQRQQLFGCDSPDGIKLSEAGESVKQRWLAIPQRFPDVLIDDFIVMPDHIHGILWMGCADADPPTSCGDVARWFKSVVLRDFTKGVRELGWHPYDGRLWQRNFYDHIIRGQKDLEAIRDYIDANPYV